MKTKHFEIVPCSLGWLIRPLDPLDNARWYFDRKRDAEEHALWLEREGKAVQS